MNKHHPLSRKNLWNSFWIFGTLMLVFLPLFFIWSWEDSKEYVLALPLSKQIHFSQPNFGPPLLLDWLGPVDAATAILSGMTSLLTSFLLASTAFLVSGIVDWVAYIRVRRYLQENLAHRRDAREIRETLNPKS